MVVRAPVGFQAFACATYERCSLSELQGVNLQDGDLVQIMSTCAQASGFTACTDPDYCVVPRIAALEQGYTVGLLGREAPVQQLDHQFRS